MDDPVFINAATSQAHHPGRVGRAILQGYWRSGYTAYRLARRDIKGTYARARLGWLWDLLDPLLFGAIFYVLVQTGTLHPGELDIPYAVFVTFGMLLYLTFTESLLAALRLFQSFKGLLAHVKLAPEALVLAVFFRMLFSSVFRILIMGAMAVALVPKPESGLVGLTCSFGLFLLLFPLLIGAGMAIGLFLAPFNAIYTDMGRLVSLILLPLRFVTPVFYNITSAKVLLINPVAVLIVNLRQLATHQGIYHGEALLVWGAFFALLFCIATWLFHLAVPVLSERA